jgi:hypothetical protein
MRPNSGLFMIAPYILTSLTPIKFSDKFTVWRDVFLINDATMSIHDPSDARLIHAMYDE